MQAIRLLLLASLIGCAAPPSVPARPAPDGCAWSTAAPAALLAGRYEAKMISRGDNRPRIDLVKTRLDALSILLHHRVPADAIRRELGWTEAAYQARVKLLVDEGLAKRDARCGALPTTMVVSVADGATLYAMVEPAAREIAAVIAAHRPELEQRYTGLGCARTLAFADASFLILSNGLLDNGQIGAVEHALVGAERTERAGLHYYEAFLEQAPGSHVEAFGIYGNAASSYGAVMLALYGNARSGHNFVTLTADELVRDFGMPSGADPGAFKVALAAELAGDAVLPAHRHGFETLGLVREGRVTTAIFHAADLPILDGMAQLVLPELLAILQRHRATFEAAYRSSPYRDEISFAEYFMWTYHFLYTRATDLLAAQGAIQIPAGGVATYVVE